MSPGGHWEHLHHKYPDKCACTMGALVFSSSPCPIFERTEAECCRQEGVGFNKELSPFAKSGCTQVVGVNGSKLLSTPQGGGKDTEREGRVFAHPAPELMPQAIPLGFALWKNSALQEASATSVDAPAGPDAPAGLCKTPADFGG